MSGNLPHIALSMERLSLPHRMIGVMMAYRIKHLPTGLYFTPSRKIKTDWGGSAKSNLSTRGKVYMRKPSLNYLDQTYYDHTKIPRRTVTSSGSYVGVECFLVPVILTEWIIEEVA